MGCRKISFAFQIHPKPAQPFATGPFNSAIKSKHIRRSTYIRTRDGWNIFYRFSPLYSLLLFPPSPSIYLLDAQIPGRHTRYSRVPTFSAALLPSAGVGVYISRIEEGSVAERAGLRPGDTILEVNGTPFTSINHEEALKVRNGLVVNLFFFLSLSRFFFQLFRYILPLQIFTSTNTSYRPIIRFRIDWFYYWQNGAVRFPCGKRSSPFGAFFRRACKLCFPFGMKYEIFQHKLSESEEKTAWRKSISESGKKGTYKYAQGIELCFDCIWMEPNEKEKKRDNFCKYWRKNSYYITFTLRFSSLFKDALKAISCYVAVLNLKRSSTQNSKYLTSNSKSNLTKTIQNITSHLNHTTKYNDKD